MLRFLGARVGNVQLHSEYRRRARTLGGLTGVLSSVTEPLLEAPLPRYRGGEGP